MDSEEEYKGCLVAAVLILLIIGLFIWAAATA